MIGKWTAGVIALGAALQGCAPPPPPVPVCAQPDVLRQVYEAVRKRGQQLVLEAPPVGEVSTGAEADVAPGPAPDRPPLAQCAVRGHTVAYDTNRYGASPVHESFTLRYTVELRRNGIFVQVD